MELMEYFRRRRIYEQRARDRFEERISQGCADGQHELHVVEEMLIDFIEKIEKIEEQVAGLEALLSDSEQEG